MSLARASGLVEPQGRRRSFANQFSLQPATAVRKHEQAFRCGKEEPATMTNSVDGWPKSGHLDGLTAACFVPDLDQWDAWSPSEITQRLSGVQAPWCVAAGWAIDLFLGQQRRDHEDLEIAVPQAHFDEVAAALPGFEFHVVGSGHAVPIAEAGCLAQEWHQTWVREPLTCAWKLDIFREPSANGQWVCRRDPRIELPCDRLVAFSASGIPYACPEVVLLFKARAARPKDDGDFAAVLPHLSEDRRLWLTEAIELLHPGHRWLLNLGD